MGAQKLVKGLITVHTVICPRVLHDAACAITTDRIALCQWRGIHLRYLKIHKDTMHQSVPTHPSRALHSALNSLVRVHLHLLGVRGDVGELHLPVCDWRASARHRPIILYRVVHIGLG